MNLIETEMPKRSGLVLEKMTHPIDVSHCHSQAAALQSHLNTRTNMANLTTYTLNDAKDPPGPVPLGPRNELSILS